MPPKTNSNWISCISLCWRIIMFFLRILLIIIGSLRPTEASQEPCNFGDPPWKVDSFPGDICRRCQQFRCSKNTRGGHRQRVKGWSCLFQWVNSGWKTSVSLLMCAISCIFSAETSAKQTSFEGSYFPLRHDYWKGHQLLVYTAWKVDGATPMSCLGAKPGVASWLGGITRRGHRESCQQDRNIVCACCSRQQTVLIILGYFSLLQDPDHTKFHVHWNGSFSVEKGDICQS